MEEAIVEKFTLPVGCTDETPPKFNPPVGAAVVPKLTPPVGAAETIGVANNPEDTLVIAAPPGAKSPEAWEAVEVPGVLLKLKFGVVDVPDNGALKDKPPVPSAWLPNEGVPAENAGAGLKNDDE